MKEIIDRFKLLQKPSFSFVFIVISISLIIYRLVTGYLQYRDIQDNKAETIGVVIDYYRVGVDNIFLKYEYEINNTKYTKIYSVPIGKRLYNCEKSKVCVGNKYLVSYSELNPEFSEIHLNKLMNGSGNK